MFYLSINRPVTSNVCFHSARHCQQQERRQLYPPTCTKRNGAPHCLNPQERVAGTSLLPIAHEMVTYLDMPPPSLFFHPWTDIRDAIHRVLHASTFPDFNRMRHLLVNEQQRWPKELYTEIEEMINNVENGSSMLSFTLAANCFMSGDNEGGGECESVTILDEQGTSLLNFS